MINFSLPPVQGAANALEARSKHIHVKHRELPNPTARVIRPPAYRNRKVNRES